MTGTESGGHAAKERRLADDLAAIANPVRIALLRQVRSPKILKEIKIHGGSIAEAGDRDRLLARQTVKEHLDKLLEAGAVVARDAERGRGAGTEYIVNQQWLYAAAEEFRSLASLRPVPSIDAVTRAASPDLRNTQVQGPCLVLVKGIDEGRTFPLMPPATGVREWLIGRRRSLDIALDYDPFVSTDNTAIRWRDGDWTLEDLPESRNGTTRNFMHLTKGRPTHLRGGDLIGVGRSLLLFYA